MRIAVCDDDRKFCYFLEEVLEQYGRKRKIFLESEIFLDGEELRKSLGSGQKYDLIFLDILMVRSDGVETGRYVRRRLGDPHTEIIYVSCAEDRVKELFPLRPAGFLIKPVEWRQIFRVLEEVRKWSRGKEPQFFFRKRGLRHQVPYSKILYYQSEGRKIRIHMSDKVLEFYGKLPELVSGGLPSNFIRIHQSFVVNMDFILDKSYQEVYLEEENAWLPVSQRYRKQVRETLQERQKGTGQGTQIQGRSADAS